MKRDFSSDTNSENNFSCLAKASMRPNRQRKSIHLNEWIENEIATFCCNLFLLFFRLHRNKELQFIPDIQKLPQSTYLRQ